MPPGVAGSYHCPPAMSRKDKSEICPVCGAMEALEPLGLGKEVIKQIIKTEHEQGRVELLDGE